MLSGSVNSVKIGVGKIKGSWERFNYMEYTSANLSTWFIVKCSTRFELFFPEVVPYVSETREVYM